MINDFQQPNQVLFLQLSIAARLNALYQMAEINEKERLYDASTSDDFAEMIVNGYILIEILCSFNMKVIVKTK